MSLLSSFLDLFRKKKKPEQHYTTTSQILKDYKPDSSFHSSGASAGSPIQPRKLNNNIWPY